MTLSAGSITLHRLRSYRRRAASATTKINELLIDLSIHRLDDKTVGLAAAAQVAAHGLEDQLDEVIEAAIKAGRAR